MPPAAGAAEMPTGSANTMLDGPTDAAPINATNNISGNVFTNDLLTLSPADWTLQYTGFFILSPTLLADNRKFFPLPGQCIM
jgi:hypothetical protein